MTESEAMKRPWRLIESAPTGRNVLIAFQNSLGKWRYAKAALVAAKAEEASSDSDWYEYDEEADTYWLPAGWYEDVEAETGNDFSRFYLDVQPTHWMPLPPPPDDGAVNSHDEARELLREAADWIDNRLSVRRTVTAEQGVSIAARIGAFLGRKK